MPNPQHAILTNLDQVPVVHALQPYRRRRPRGDQEATLEELRAAGSQVGVTTPVNVCVLFGPTLLADLTDDMPDDFQPYPGYESPDGKVAKATQEELLRLDPLRREGPVLGGAVQLPQRGRRTHDRGPRDADVHLPQQPRPHGLHRRDRQPGARATSTTGRSSPRASRVPVARSASRSVGSTTSTTSTGCRSHDQENTFGRTKADSTKLDGAGADLAPQPRRAARGRHRRRQPQPKRGEMVRRSTPYAFHDGTVGLYFMGFCREQAPMRERMEAIYGMNGQAPRRAHRLLDARVGLVLLRAVGRDPAGHHRVTAAPRRPVSGTPDRRPAGHGSRAPSSSTRRFTMSPMLTSPTNRPASITGV